MKTSYAKQTVNPSLPCHMEGYNDRISEKLADNLELRTIMIESNELVVIHVLDILLITKAFSQRVKQKLAEQFCLQESNIIIQASHTHSGPKVSTYLFPEILPSKEYLDLLEQSMIDNTEQCKMSLIESTAFYGKTTVNGLYSNRNDKNQPYNNQLSSILFRNEEHRPIVQIVNLACHPTVLSPVFKEISSDFFGTFREAYEKRTGIPLITMNGEAGDVSTRYTREGQGYEEVKRLGEALALRLTEIKDYIPLSLDQLKISVCELDYDYHPQQDEYLNETRSRLKQALAETDVDESTSALVDLLKTVEKKLSKETIQYHYTSIIIEAENFRLVTFPGEVVSVLGSRIREASEKILFILAYADDFKGYAVDLDAFGKIPETMTSEFPKGVADQFVDQIVKTFN